MFPSECGDDKATRIGSPAATGLSGNSKEAVDSAVVFTSASSSATREILTDCERRSITYSGISLERAVSSSGTVVTDGGTGPVGAMFGFLLESSSFEAR